MKILIMDFLLEESKLLKTIFEPDDYEVISSNYSKDILDRVISDYFGLIILNILPKKEDFSLKRIQSIRNESMIPIIVISEENDKMRKILAFDYGADDFILKPFDAMELRARIRVMLRRENYYRNLQNQSTELNLGELSVNTVARKVSYKNKIVEFTNKEFDLFLTLFASPNKIFEREKLLEKVWGYSCFGDVRTVDVHIRRIRQKLQQINPDTSFICTKWGVGYYFDEKLI